MTDPTPQERRARGLARMSEVYGFDVSDGPGDLFAHQAGAALSNGEVDADQLREIALFLTYYIGWPLGTKVEFAVGKAISDHRRKLRDAEKKDS